MRLKLSKNFTISIENIAAIKKHAEKTGAKESTIADILITEALAARKIKSKK